MVRKGSKLKLSAPDSAITGEGYMVRMAGAVRGPINLEGLRSLVEIGKLTPEAEFALAHSTEFKPAEAWDFCGMLFPDKMAMAPTARPTTPVKPKEPGHIPSVSDAEVNAPRKSYQFKEATFERINAEPGVFPTKDVYQILETNRQAEQGAGLDRGPKRRFKIARRTQHFWLVLILVNPPLIYLAFKGQNFISPVYPLSGVVLFTLGFTWLMYGIMERH